MAAVLRCAVFVTFFLMVASFTSENKTRTVSESCPSAGIHCLDCKTLALCVDVGDGYLEFGISTCDAPGEACSQSLKDCSDRASYCTRGGSFMCQGEGFFLDPYECNVYHECGSPAYDGQEDYDPLETHVCPTGTAYNPKSGACDLSVSHPSCSYDKFPVPLCENPGARLGTVETNPSYYWICINGVVRIFKCADGFIFDMNVIRCVPQDDEGQITTTESPEGFKCSSNGREPDPSNCYRYYDCSDTERPLHLACPLLKYYHRRKQRCILGVCPY